MGAGVFAGVRADQVDAILGAMTAVIEPGGVLGRQMVSGAAALLFGRDVLTGDDVADPVSPARFAAALGGDAALQRAASELVAVAALADGMVAAPRLDAALAYADCLAGGWPWTKELRDIAEGRLERAMHDMVVRNAATFPGLASPGVEPDLMPYTGTTDQDRRLFARFEQLEGYPSGTFGRAFWVHFRRHGFRFPGQDGAFNAAFAVPHDGLHVLSGYDTSMQGELLVGTFTGRMHATDALSAHILPVIFQWHIGQDVNRIGAQHGALDPWKFFIAWQRGTTATTDVLGTAWQFFDAAPVALDELRRRYGIPGLPDRYRASGPEVNVTAEADPAVQ